MSVDAAAVEAVLQTHGVKIAWLYEKADISDASSVLRALNRASRIAGALRDILGLFFIEAPTATQKGRSSRPRPSGTS